ncbi:MAG: hypothetical protein ACR652_07215 [Methylocystis sp.]|uniref:hypothetical protein n=1 Tax=Methylocystis sp. TaxID=1911079 RepID=UPI003DA681FA
MVEETENFILHALRQLDRKIGELDKKVDGMGASLRPEIADVRSEVRSLRADVASDLMTVEKRLGDQIAGLRRSVIEYHSSAIGHGVLFSELEGKVRATQQQHDERIRRIEQHLNLPPQDKH